MESEIIDKLLASLASTSNNNNNNNNNDHNNQPTPTQNQNQNQNNKLLQENSWFKDEQFTLPTPTRSGRIPQRPDPNQSSLLDFLIFPEDSESDDPDFNPLKVNQNSTTSSCSSSNYPSPQILQPEQNQIINHFNNNSNNQQQLHHQIKKTNSNSSLDLSIKLDSNNNPPHLPTNQQFINNSIGFDFSSLSGKNQNQLNTINQPDQSPPIQPGIPFININFPESDDSPEFIPPHSPAQRSTLSTTLSAKKRSRRELNSRQSDHYNPILNNSHASGSSYVNKNASSDTRVIDPCLQSSSSGLKKTRQDVKQTRSIQLPPSISARYLAIAPSPNYPTQHHTSSHHHQTNLNLNQQSESQTIRDSDEQSETSTRHTSSRLNETGKAPRKSKCDPVSSQLKSATATETSRFSRSSSDVKPSLSLDLHRHDAMERKREGMRQSRERKKLYIVSLEDRCLELAEENARLKEENQVLIRESRENWKTKAKTLELIKSLTTEIEQLKQQKKHEEISRKKVFLRESLLTLTSTSNQERINNTKNKKIKKKLMGREVHDQDQEAITISSSSTSSSSLLPSFVDQNNNNNYNKKRKIVDNNNDDDDSLNNYTHLHSKFNSSASSFPSSRPSGRSLLDIVAVKPR